MPLQTCPGAEIIPGYRLVERLGTGGFGEVWKTTAPGGLTKALKIVYGYMNEARAEQELKSLDRMKSVRHPFLLSLERVEVVEEQLLIVTELAEQSLADRFLQCKNAGLPGIPRTEMLGYMRDVAEALDYLNEQYGLQHLDIKPQNLLLVAGRMKVADFGLVKDLRGGSATATGGVTPFYATPEAFDGRVSRFSDQYSLAIVYEEMLSGERPFPGTTALQLAVQHAGSEPLLHFLPLCDRPTIARALAKVPEARFPSCRDMVASLVAAGTVDPTDIRTPVKTGIRKKGSSAIIARKAEPPSETPADIPIATPADAHSAPTLICDNATPLPGQLPAADGANRALPLTKPAADTGLRPTLIVGIGGIACWTLRQLRQKLQRRFGDVSAVPALRMLLLDTDRTMLQQAHQGEGGEALDPDETLLIPLHRPEHYREQAPDILKWLDRRWLYNIPRSQLTEGIRPLGRLALVDNAGDVLARVKEALSALTSGPAKAATAQASGLALRNELPQVFVVASIAGGTGGGAVLDLAYALRQALQECKVGRAGVSGFLIHATSQRPAEEDLARLNSYTALNELQHYSQPGARYLGDRAHGIAAPAAGIRPFDDCYVVHLGERLDEAGLQSSINRLADYLYVNIATSVGAFLERWRLGSRSVAVDGEDGLPVRAFGHHRYSFARHHLITLAAAHLCTHLVERWQGEHIARSEQLGPQEAAAAVGDLGLGSEEVERELNKAAVPVLGEAPEKYLLQEVVGLPPRNPDSGALDRDTIERCLQRIAAFFHAAPVEDTEALTPAMALESALCRRVQELSDAAIAASKKWLIGLIEHPDKRLQGAYRASNLLRHQLTVTKTNLLKELERLRSYQRALRERLPAELLAENENRSRRPGSAHDQPKPDTVGKLTEFCACRLREAVLQKSVAVFGSVATHLAELTEELANMQRRLKSFAESFAPLSSRLDSPGEDSVALRGQVELLPLHAQDLAEAARKLFRRFPPEGIRAFDESFQQEILAPLGGLWGVVTATDERGKEVKQELSQRAYAQLSGATTSVDAASLLVELWPEPAQARQELDRQLTALPPEWKVPEEFQHLVIALPQSKPGRALQELLDSSSFAIPSTFLDVDDDIILCHETAGLPLQEVAAILAGDPERYIEAAAQVVTRLDVAWSFRGSDPCTETTRLTTA